MINIAYLSHYLLFTTTIYNMYLYAAVSWRLAFLRISPYLGRRCSLCDSGCLDFPSSDSWTTTLTWGLSFFNSPAHPRFGDLPSPPSPSPPKNVRLDTLLHHFNICFTMQFTFFLQQPFVYNTHPVPLSYIDFRILRDTLPLMYPMDEPIHTDFVYIDQSLFFHIFNFYTKVQIILCPEDPTPYIFYFSYIE